MSGWSDHSLTVTPRMQVGRYVARSAELQPALPEVEGPIVPLPVRRFATSIALTTTTEARIVERVIGLLIGHPYR